MNFNAATQVMPWHERLAQKTPASGDASAAEFLRSSAGLAHPAAAPLRACRDALAHLATLDAAALTVMAAVVVSTLTDDTILVGDTEQEPGSAVASAEAEVAFRMVSVTEPRQDEAARISSDTRARTV